MGTLLWKSTPSSSFSAVTLIELVVIQPLIPPVVNSTALVRGSDSSAGVVSLSVNTSEIILTAEESAAVARSNTHQAQLHQVMTVGYSKSGVLRCWDADHPEKLSLLQQHTQELARIAATGNAYQPALDFAWFAVQFVCGTTVFVKLSFKILSQNGTKKPTLIKPSLGKGGLGRV